jgi:hypothetical protein
MCALKYIKPQRFDLLAKIIYAKYELAGIKTSFHKDLYAHHIHVFNGATEPPGVKTTIAHFFKDFDELIWSMKNKGFDKKHPVPVGNNNIIINGAHRVSVSYLLGINPEIKRQNVRPSVYDFNFFKNRKRFVKSGLLNKYSTQMALEYCRIHQNARMVIVFPSAVGKRNQLESHLKTNGSIIHQSSFNVTQTGLLNLIKELYHNEPWIGNNANNWKGGDVKKRKCWGKSGLVSVYVYHPNNLGKVVETKQKIRTIYKLQHNSIHINDTHEETLRIARCVLTQHSHHFLNKAPTKLSAKNIALFNKLSTFHNQLSQDQKESIVVDSSFVLGMYGLRDANDVDVLVGKTANASTKNLIKTTSLLDNHNHEIQKYSNLNIDDLVYNPENYFYYHNIKFMNLKVLKEFKTIRNEPKDKVDISLINKIL